MKKSTRRFVSLVLVACLAMAFALSVSAASYIDNGTYKNQGFTCTSNGSRVYFIAEMGSSSTYNLLARVEYDIKETSGYESLNNIANSLTKPSFTSVERGIATGGKFTREFFQYYIDGSRLHTRTMRF